MAVKSPTLTPPIALPAPVEVRDKKVPSGLDSPAQHGIKSHTTSGVGAVDGRDPTQGSSLGIKIDPYLLEVFLYTRDPGAPSAPEIGAQWISRSQLALNLDGQRIAVVTGNKAALADVVKGLGKTSARDPQVGRDLKSLHEQNVSWDKVIIAADTTYDSTRAKAQRRDTVVTGVTAVATGVATFVLAPAAFSLLATLAVTAVAASFIGVNVGRLAASGIYKEQVGPAWEHTTGSRREAGQCRAAAREVVKGSLNRFLRSVIPRVRSST